MSVALGNRGVLCAGGGPASIAWRMGAIELEEVEEPRQVAGKGQQRMMIAYGDRGYAVKIVHGKTPGPSSDSVLLRRIEWCDD